MLNSLKKIEKMGLVVGVVFGLFFSLSAFLLATPVQATAGINDRINFQGKLTNTDGTNVTDGSAYELVFKLYNVSSGGSNIWTETQTAQTVTNGVFQVQLGSVTSLSTVDFNNTALYLGIQVTKNAAGAATGDSEMTPRLQFAAVPYAFNAQKVNGLAVTNNGGNTLNIAANKTFTVNNTISLNGTDSTTFTLPSTSGGTVLTSNAPSQTITSTQTSGTGLAFSDATNITAAVVGQSISLSGTGAFDQTGLQFNLSGATGTNLNDIVGSGSSWKVSKSGALTVSSCSGCGGGGSSTLQQAYDTDADGGNATISLTAADDGLVITNPSSGGTDASAFLLQLSQANTTAAVAALDISQVSNAANGVNITANSSSAYAALAIAQTGTGAAISVNNTGSGPLMQLQTSGIDKFTVGNNGGLTINGADSSIVRESTADFALGTVGSSLLNANDSLSLSDTVTGGIPNSGKGTITTGSQPATSANIGAGAFAITRADGDYLVIRGGGTGIDIYDPLAGTFTNSSMVLNNAAGVGALALPRPGGLYRILHGGGATTTSLVDPMGALGVGVSVAAAAKGAGTVAFLRPDGRYLVTNAPTLATTQLYDPIADTFVTGPSGSGGNWGVGAAVLHRTDGQALILVGGALSTTQLYNPSAGAITGTGPIGAFTAGPSLDGNQASGTCGLNGNGAVTFRRQDGKFVILSKANVWATYDAVANTITCNTSGGPATAIGDGGHAIPLQNGNFLVIVGGGSTASYIYDTSTDTFSSQGTALTAVTTGAFSLMRYDGKWQIITGTNTCTAGCTNNYDTGLPMSDSNTLYTSENIFNSSLTGSSTFWWRSQSESVYTGTYNSSTNTASSTLQYLVGTAVSSNGLLSGCGTPLDNATYREIQKSGDPIDTVAGANCVRVKIQYNRTLPKKLFDERGVWAGNGMTATRLDYVTPRLYNYKIDNSSVLKRSNFDFTYPAANAATNPVVPAALTATQSAGGGTCTAGTHAYYVTFVTAGVESALGTVSNTITCVGGTDKVNLTAIPLGPSGTTARKIYRTAAGNTGTPYLVTTIADNSTTTLTSDTNADTALGAAYATIETSGPVMTRSETRVEAYKGNLVLPYGRITQTTQVPTTSGYYSGLFTAAHPTLNNVTGAGTVVIARDDKKFIIIESGGQFADLYDPATETFTNQTSTGDKPTGSVGTGAFAQKRPDGTFLVYLGAGATTTTCTTAGTATNIYDSNQAAGSHFVNGPCLTAAGGIGAQAILNNDGSITIVHGNATTATSIYNPITNSMIVGPITTTAVNCGSWAIPMLLPHNNQYKVKAGVAAGATAVATGMMNYDADSKVFSAAPNLSTISGCGSFAFQRDDSYWVITEGETAGVTGLVTSIMNPYNGTTAAGPSMVTSGTGHGAHVIPRADGTFLIVLGNPVNNANVVETQIYYPTGGTAANALGVPAGTFSASTFGPDLVVGPGTAAAAAPTAGTPTSGGSCTAGTHSYRYTYVINGVETIPSASSTAITCVTTTGQTVPLTVVSVGPTGTTARKIYKTIAGNTGAWKLVGTIADNVTTTFSDTIADGSLGANSPQGPGDGAISFQRPDGKFVTIFGGQAGTNQVNLYDAGWYSDGQYLSEMMQVPALGANATLEWQKTDDSFVRFEARVASSKAALQGTSFVGVDVPGGSISNAGGETWAQVEINFKRDFPSFCGNMDSVYSSGAGLQYCYRKISLPTVMQYQISNGQDLLSLKTNNYNVLRVTSTGGIYSSQQGGFFAGGADLAENYTSTQSLSPGDVVVIDQSNSEGVKKSTVAYQKDIVGVVSTTPGLVTGAYTKDSYPIALIGRVPVKISNEAGPIQAGDYLTASSVPGYAMKAIMSGRVIGKALESMDPSKLTDCPTLSTLDYPEGRKCGTISMFVNLTNSTGTPLADLMNSTQATDSANLNVSGLTTVDPQFSIGLSGSESKILTFLKQLGAQNELNSMPSSQILADQIYATGTVTSSRIVTDTLFANHIEAGSIEGLEIYTDQLSSLSEKVKNLATASASVQNQSGLKVSPSATPVADKNIFSTIAQFLSDVIYKGNVQFFGRATFNSDSAGFALIKTDAQEVQVTFTTPYTDVPVVVASPDKNVQFAVTDVDVNKFLIKMNQAASENIRFSWTATAVNGAKTFESTVSGSLASPTPSLLPSPSTLLLPSIAPSPTASSSSLLIPAATQAASSSGTTL